jgi:hypothetical protein
VLTDPLSVELAQARRAVEATRGVVKSQIRSLRTCLSFVADLDERLRALEEELAAAAPDPPIGGADNRNA